MKIDYLINHIDWFGNGFDQTTVLLALCVLDTAFGISVRLMQHQKLRSQTFLAGVIHNFVPALIPSLLTLGEFTTRHFIMMYAVVSFFLFIVVAYFLLQSILANAVLLGLDVDWIKKWLSDEIAEKTVKKK